MEKNKYKQLIQEFIIDNKYTTLQHDPTKQYERSIMNIINTCNINIQKQNKHTFYNPNPLAPTIRATIKIHKNPIRMRPIINWTNAPECRLTIHTSEIWKQNLALPNTYNVSNTKQPINDLNNIDINPNTKLCSFDINMYTNIPVTPLKEIKKSWITITSKET
jgi:hypothetical protein